MKEDNKVESGPISTPKKSFDIMNLVEQGAKNETLEAWVEFKFGIELQMRFVPRPVFKKLADSCTMFKYNPKTNVREPQPDSERLMREFAKKAVVGCRGLTPRTLCRLLPFDLSQVPEVDQDEELKLTDQLMQKFLTEVYEFDRFLQEVAMDVSYFNPTQDEEVKN